MNMKKLLSFALAALLVVSLAACGGSTSSSAAPAASGSTAPAASSAAGSAAADSGAKDAKDVKIGILIPGSPTDGGFSQQAAEAGKKIESTFGYTVSVVEAASAEEIKQEGETMADDGYDIVYGHGGQCSAPLAEICEDYPDTWFVTFGGTEIRDNLFPVIMCAEEGTYVAGVASGMMTETNKIGITLGGDFPAYTKTTTGWALGAKSVNPDIEVMTAVLSSPDANECYETTLNQIKSGADQILSNSNEGQAGAMKAVSESEGVYTIGCLGDFISLAPEQVIMNVICDYGAGYLDATKQIMAGTVKAEPMFLTIANGCVDIQWNEAVKSTLPEDVIAAVEKAYEDVKSGAVEVPNEYEQDKAQEMLDA